MLNIYLILITVVSLIAFWLYFIDKTKARAGAWRIPERVLLIVGLFGGALGALAAMHIFRHKTRHFYFYVINVLGLILQAATTVLITIYF